MKWIENTEAKSIPIVTYLDEEKRKIHDKICKTAGTTRDDNDFQIWLANTSWNIMNKK